MTMDKTDYASVLALLRAHGIDTLPIDDYVYSALRDMEEHLGSYSAACETFAETFENQAKGEGGYPFEWFDSLESIARFALERRPAYTFAILLGESARRNRTC